MKGEKHNKHDRAHSPRYLLCSSLDSCSSTESQMRPPRPGCLSLAPPGVFRWMTRCCPGPCGMFRRVCGLHLLGLRSKPSRSVCQVAGLMGVLTSTYFQSQISINPALKAKVANTPSLRVFVQLLHHLYNRSLKLCFRYQSIYN